MHPPTDADEHATMSENGPAWARRVLWAAAVYNVAFGAWAVVWPAQWFELGGMDVPAKLFVWQCVGMIVGVYGVGYACAAARPLRHWPIVLVGFLGKVFGRSASSTQPCAETCRGALAGSSSPTT